GQRNERNINHANIDKLLNLIACEESGIDLFKNGHAGIIAEFPVQLTVTDIHRVNLFGAPLKHAIGKTACGGANIQHSFSLHIDLKLVEGAFNLERPPADLLWVRFYGDRCPRIGESRWLRRDWGANLALARQYRPPRLLPAWENSMPDEQL